MTENTEKDGSLSWTRQDWYFQLQKGNWFMKFIQIKSESILKWTVLVSVQNCGSFILFGGGGDRTDHVTQLEARILLSEENCCFW